MAGPSDKRSEIDLTSVEERVGSRSFGRGRGYARGGRVMKVKWDPDGLTLSGAVVGSALYSTTAYFVDFAGSLVLEDGDCTCPVGYNCKHVAAIAIVGADGPRRAGLADPTATVDGPAWERPLRALIDDPAAATGERPLAIELSLREAGGRLRLTGRLMRPGARDRWVNGSLSWDGLDSWEVQDGGYRSDHLALLRELHAIHRAGEQRTDYYGYAYRYGGHRDRTLDLSDCDSPRLWALLDEAARIELPLLHAPRGLGELPPYGRGELLIDVGRDGRRGSLATAVLRLDDDDADPPGLEPLLFLGASGHGVVCAEREERAAADEGPDGVGAGSSDPSKRRLRLVRLARPAPPRLQRMVLDRERLEIPAGELDRFAAEIFPALRHVATVASADGSFTPPAISEPSLVLRAGYGDGHAVELDWRWEYRIGSEARQVPLSIGPGAPGFRDRRAERAILAATTLAGSGLESLGLLDAVARPTEAPTVSLAGIETMRLTTELLPRLEEHGVTVEIVGEPADYRDVGDSLTIGVSTAEIPGERDWFDLGVTIGVEGRELPFADVFVALAAGESHLLLDDGAHLSLQDPRLESLRALITEAQALADSSAAPLRINPYQAGLWAELAALGVVTEQAEAWRRRTGALLELDEVVSHDPPAALAAELRPYQRDGFGWLASLWELGLGGILADDMGLGKTLQTLALLCHARRRDPGGGPFLVVAPTSVVSNWVGEAARFAPELAVDAVTDTLRKSGRAIEEVAAADVVVTTYTLFRLDAEAYRGVDWAGLILDEAQAVKNHQSKTYKCVRELAAPFKLALTGTPMENNLGELWSLLSIAAPGLFPDPKRFAEHYARPIERDGDEELLARLRRRIKPLVKRRTKELVAADLPPKQEQTLEVELHARHRKLYETRLQRERQKILGLIDDFDRNRFTILRSITLLRQLSIDPGLVDEAHGDVPCAKLAALVEQLGEVIGGGHRALVFSQFTGFLAKVRDRLDREGIGYCYLDGRTRRRERAIERFKQGTDPVFLISLKAGGFGLNLTEADYCFLLDPWWNPATETQAIDRAHRIGQTRPVIAYRMIARDTIEEKVVALARRKAELFRGVMDDGDLFAGSLTADDIRGLLDEPPRARRRQAGEALAEAA
jgi:superfamily II DNA or RNA helicase